MPKPIRLPRSIVAEIIAHAREGKPEEVCGILRGRDNRATDLYRARNIAADRIENYTVDPQTLLKQFEFEEQGDRMVAIYHSHPVSEAYPSATDAWNAHYPDSVYLICSLEQDDAPVIRGFYLWPEYPDLDIQALRRALPFREVRPRLFGYYQPADAPVPEVLAELVAETPPPFYIVFSTDAAGQVEDARVVQVVEVPVVVEEAEPAPEPD